MDGNRIEGYAEITEMAYGRLIGHIASSVVDDYDGDRAGAASAVDDRRRFAPEESKRFLDDILVGILGKS